MAEGTFHFPRGQRFMRSLSSISSFADVKPLPRLRSSGIVIGRQGVISTRCAANGRCNQQPAEDENGCRWAALKTSVTAGA